MTTGASGVNVSPLDFAKGLESAYGLIAGGTPASYVPGEDLDGVTVTNLGTDARYMLVATVTAAAGYTLTGDATQTAGPGQAISFTFNDPTADANAVEQIDFSVVDVSAVTPGATVTLGSALTAAPATAVIPFIVNGIES